MAQAAAESSKRAWLKAAEVCDRAQVQAYVLRTWELEFPDLGVVKNPGGPRLYRPADVDRVLRIKQLVFGDGLTLAGARRKLEEERRSLDELPFDDIGSPAELSAEARERIVAVRDGLRALLGVLSAPPDPRTTGVPPGAAIPTPVVHEHEASASAATGRKASRRRKSS